MTYDLLPLAFIIVGLLFVAGFGLGVAIERRRWDVAVRPRRLQRRADSIAAIGGKYVN